MSEEAKITFQSVISHNMNFPCGIKFEQLFLTNYWYK